MADANNLQKNNKESSVKVDISNIRSIPLSQLKAKYEYIDGYYRYQNDNQPVIERTEEELKIRNEFFIIENLKTTTCSPELKRIAHYLCIAAVVAFVLNAILLLFSILNIINALIIGIIFLLAGIGLIIAMCCLNNAFMKSVSTLTHPNVIMEDEEYEALVAKKFEYIKDFAHERLGLDKSQTEEVKPIIVTANAVRDYTLKYFNKEKNKIYTSTQSIMILFFTDEQLFVYKMVFDMCCNVQEEYTNEFFYDDICDVSSKVNKNIIVVDNYKIEYSMVAFEIVVSNSSVNFQIEGNRDRLESLQALKQKIRDKRNVKKLTG